MNYLLIEVRQIITIFEIKAIHQFSPESGLHILQELKKISRSVVIIDYTTPQPRNFSGFIVRTIERIAGKEHFTHFMAYEHGGGMPEILYRLELSVSNEVVSNSGIFTIWKIFCSEANPAQSPL